MGGVKLALVRGLTSGKCQVPQVWALFLQRAIWAGKSLAVMARGGIAMEEGSRETSEHEQGERRALQLCLRRCCGTEQTAHLPSE